MEALHLSNLKLRDETGYTFSSKIIKVYYPADVQGLSL